jgi:transcriptional regulator with XRE-family HTH domain
MNYVDVLVGDIIKQRRRMLRLTQTQLGDKVGIAFSTLACYEKGIRGMSLNIFFKICDALSLDPNDVQRQVEEQLNK